MIFMSWEDWNIFMIKKYNFDFLKEPFEEWFELKADEIYDSGENAANILNDYYKKNGVDFYKIYIEPIKNLSKIERDAFLKALSFHLANDYSPMPDKVKYVITQGMDPMPNALDWLLVHVFNLNLFEFDISLLERGVEPVNQCVYCGKPNFYVINNGSHDIKIKFNRKRKFCHTYICNDVNQSNPEAHEKDCHYGIWIRKKKSLIERMSQVSKEKAIKIFLDFCEKQLKENLKIKYLVQYDENQKYKKLTDITNCPEEDLFFNINHIWPIKKNL